MYVVYMVSVAIIQLAMHRMLHYCTVNTIENTCTSNVIREKN